MRHIQKTVTIILFSLICNFFTGQQLYAVQGQNHLIISNSEAWPPFSFLNEDGEPTGILVDLWQEFGRRNNTTVEFKLVNWQSSLDQVRTKQADVHAGLFKNKERELFLDFTEPLDIPLATRLFVSQKLKVTGVSDLGTINVGVTKGGYADSFIREHHPSLQLLHFPNSRETVLAAISGKIVAFVTDYPAAMYYLHKFGSPEQFHTIETLYSEQLRAAVPKGNRELLESINAGLNKIPVEEFERITQKWMQSEKVVPEALITVLVVVLTLLLLLFVVIYIHALRRNKKELRLLNTELESKVNKRTKKLSELNSKLTEEIRERHGVEEKLLESEERYRTIANFNFDWEYWIGADGDFIYVSPSCERITGYPPQMFYDSNKFLYEIVHPEDQRILADHKTAVAKTDKQCGNIDFRIVTKSGEIRWVNHVCQAVFGSDGHFKGRRGSNRDVTERKWEEFCLKRLNELKGDLLTQGNLSRQLKLVTDFIIGLFEADFCRIWMICPGDLCEGGCLHSTCDDSIHSCKNRDQCLHLLASSGRYSNVDGGHRRVPIGSYKIGRLAAGLDISFLTNEVTTDDRIHDQKWAKELGLVSFAGYRLLASDGRPLGVLALFSKKQITQTENALLENIATTVSAVMQLAKVIEQLRESVKVQSVLFQEVNHRVKNNLTAIISMLHQEEDRAEKEGGKEYVARLNEVLGRINGLVTVHSLLSSSKWRPLSLGQLCKSVVQGSVQVAHCNQLVHVEVASSDILVGANQAHYLALIINELTTNTMKYALHGSSGTQIKVSLGCQKGIIELLYQDNGPGYQEAILRGEIPNSCIGFKLITGMVEKSLQGEIELTNDRGAVARITFPESKE